MAVILLLQALLISSGEIKGKKAVVLAGTAPVGQCAAIMLAKEGASEVIVSSRQLSRTEKACADMKSSFDVDITAAEAVDCDARGKLIEDAQVVFAAGAAGVELLKPEHWENTLGK